MKTLVAVCIFFCGVAMAIEEPEFQVVSKTEDYEVRRYSAVLVAETKVNETFEDAGNKAFRILADYIFGSNKSKTKIAMTAPVSQSKTSSGYLVQFTMPKTYTMETLPTPNDARVELRQIPPRTVAVFSYSGSWSESRYQKKLAEFLAALQKNFIKTVGEPVLARFNSPFQLWFLRRNEIWIEISI